MLKSSQQRLFCASVRTKRSQSTPLQQLENQGKQYRTLLAVFTNNISTQLKRHRDCLGDVDSYPKMKMSREQYQWILDQLEKVYMKMEDKIIKDSINRNVTIKKSIDQYRQTYMASFNDRNSSQDLKQYQFSNLQQTSKKYLLERKQLTISPMKRPLSSKQVKPSRPNLFHQLYQNFQSSQTAQTYKIKTISAHANENPQVKKAFGICNQSRVSKGPSRIKKTIVNNKNRYDNIQSQKQKEYQQFLFNGEEIMINERKSKENPNDYELQSQNTPYSCKHSTNRMINLKFTQAKSINEIQKMQIQNRIMLINSALSVNLVQSQGYRPKSRCWQNYFN